MKRQVPNPVPNYYNLNHLAQKLMLVGTPMLSRSTGRHSRCARSG